MPKFTDRLAHAWNAFTLNDKNRDYANLGISSGRRDYRPRLTMGNERTIISSVYTQIALDIAEILIQHVRLDQNGRFAEVMQSGLNNCLTVEANIDQTAQAFKIDIVLSLFDKGVVAIVPVDTTLDPNLTSGYDIQTMRVGEILAWYPRHVRVRVYNDKTGMREEVTLPKSLVAIVENPLYAVMNEPNSTLQRLVTKLALMDSVDQQSSSGKLDMIIQLPYSIKNETRKKMAADRRSELEVQLKDSTYGIGYIDGTERITQLNRPAENNLLAQVTYLTGQLYSQLGLSEEVFQGTADEKTMINYYNRTVSPVLNAIVSAMHRTFLTKTGRSQGQAIMYFRDPFKLVPLSQLADIADKFTRNEILSSNELRGIVGYKPSSDPNADKLRNKNLNEQVPTQQPSDQTPPGTQPSDQTAPLTQPAG